MNVIDLLTKLGIPYDASGRNKNRKGWVNTRCPKCGRWPYYGINEQYLFGTAWCCGYQPLTQALAVLSGKSESEIKTLIGDLPHQRKAEKEQHTGTLELPYGLEDKLSPLHRDYLSKRKLDPDVCEKLWGLRTIGMLGGRLKFRIFIPVHQRGQVVAWTTRNVTNQEPRYVSARPDQCAVPIEDTLFGIDYVRHCAVIVEGPMDVMRIGPGAVALLGTRVSARQLNALALIPLCVFCLDRDRPGETAAQKLAALLSPLPNKTLIARLESANDPGGASQDEIDELRRRFLN